MLAWEACGSLLGVGCRCPRAHGRWRVGLGRPSLSGGVGPVASKGCTYTLSLSTPLPGCSLPSGKPDCGPPHPEMPGAVHYPHGEHSLSSPCVISGDFALPGSCLCCVRSSVCDGLVCALLSQIAQWLLLVGGLVSPSIFLCVWI